MVTSVGTEADLPRMITDLIYLERDAIAAYESTIEKLSDKAMSAHVQDFLVDHRQHLEGLNRLAHEVGANAPQEGDMKQMLTTGKIALAGLMGDSTILKAMKTNEDDTVAAYERAKAQDGVSDAARTLFKKAYADELRHRDWMESQAHAL